MKAVGVCVEVVVGVIWKMQLSEYTNHVRGGRGFVL